MATGPGNAQRPSPASLSPFLPREAAEEREGSWCPCLRETRLPPKEAYARWTPEGVMVTTVGTWAPSAPAPRSPGRQLAS